MKILDCYSDTEARKKSCKITNGTRVFACSGAWINARLKESEKKFPASFAYEDDAVKNLRRFRKLDDGAGWHRTLHSFSTRRSPRGPCSDKASGKSYPLDGAIPIVQFQLDFVTPAGKSDQKQPEIRLQGRGQEPGRQDPRRGHRAQSGQPQGIPPIPGLVSDVLGVALAHAFIASRQELSFVFAELSLAPPAGASMADPQAADLCLSAE